MENCPELLEKADQYDRRQRLFPRVLQGLFELQQEGEHTYASDIRWKLGKEFEQDEILDTLSLLEEWGFVKKAEPGFWISLMAPRVAATRVRSIVEALEKHP